LVLRVSLQTPAQLAERFHHQVGILTKQRTFQIDGLMAKSGQQQGAIGQAFRPGQANLPVDRVSDGKNGERIGIHRHWAAATVQFKEIRFRVEIGDGDLGPESVAVGFAAFES
jgi:hypothetical protein